MDEIRQKLDRVVQFLDRSNLDAVMLWQRPNFAWLTGGRDNHVGKATNVGVAGLLARKDGSLACLASSIESRRYREEELAGLGIDVLEYPWWDPAAAREFAREVVGSARVGCDHDQFGVGWPGLPPEFTRLRQTLTPQELDRYRSGAAIVRDAMETTVQAIKPGMTELEIAGLLEANVRSRGGHPTCVLIAADERLDKFRHPIPTPRRFERLVMLVLGSEYRGLISSLTRIVHVGTISSDLQRRLQAVADVDAAAILGTRPGRPLKDIFSDIQLAYDRAGFADEWKHHHQGGLTAYVGREQLANPGVDRVVETNQAFAWNPSVPGCKSEDTILLTETGFEIITGATGLFPPVRGRAGEVGVDRCGILEL